MKNVEMGSSERKRGPSKKQMLLALFVAGIGALCTFLIATNPDKFPLPHLVKQGIVASDHQGGQVRCFLVSSSGAGENIRIKLAVPYRHLRQREELVKKMPRLQNDFLMAMSRPEMKGFIEARNFEGMRYQFLQIVNNHLKDSVEDIYFEAFFRN